MTTAAEFRAFFESSPIKLRHPDTKTVGHLYPMPIQERTQYELKERLERSLHDKTYLSEHLRFAMRMSDLLIRKLPNEAIRAQAINQAPAMLLPDYVAWEVPFDGKQTNFSFKHHAYTVIVRCDPGRPNPYGINVFLEDGETVLKGWVAWGDALFVLETLESLLVAMIALMPVGGYFETHVQSKLTPITIVHETKQAIEEAPSMYGKPHRETKVTPWNEGHKIKGVRETPIMRYFRESAEQEVREGKATWADNQPAN